MMVGVLAQSRGVEIVMEGKGMPYDITFDPGESIFRIRTTGTVSRDGFEQLLEGLLKHPKWRSGMSLLSDYSDAEASSLSADDVRDLAQFYASLKDRLGPGRSAIVVSDALAFGIARMGISIAELKVSRQFRVFRSVQDAEQWLKRPDAT
jgi:hypothetical protein